MLYNKHRGESLEEFETCVIHSHATGSRYICDPAPQDTDNDTVFLVNGYYDYETFLLKTGWECCGKDYEGESEFSAFRKGEENYILTENEDFYLSYVKATEGAKALNLTNKEDRIKLFKAINQTGIKGRVNPLNIFGTEILHPEERAEVAIDLAGRELRIMAHHIFGNGGVRRFQYLRGEGDDIE